MINDSIQYCYDVAAQLRLSVQHVFTVAGGDINAAFCLQTTTGNYFLKLNDATAFPGMFEAETVGLKTLAAHSSIAMPAPVAAGRVADKHFLLMEWVEQGKAVDGFWELFGRKLADLHRQTQASFGFESDNYIGSLPQLNTVTDSWAAFYSRYRILPLTKLLREHGLFTAVEVAAAERLCQKLDALFPSEQPALLHGDLWSGNYLINHNGQAVLIDPAVYYGHREMDIGMMLLFGGFDAKLLNAYNEVYPLQPGWQQRIRLTQLYPVLVHAVLFGGHYIHQAKQIIVAYA